MNNTVYINIGFGNPMLKESIQHVCQYLSNIDIKNLANSLDISFSLSTYWKPKDDDTAVVKTTLLLSGYELDRYIEQLLIHHPYINARASQSEYRLALDIFQYMPIFREAPKCLPELQHTLVNNYNIRDHVSNLLNNQTQYTALLNVANDQLQIELNWLSENSHVIYSATEDQFIDSFPKHIQPCVDRNNWPHDHARMFVSRNSSRSLYYNFTEKQISLIINDIKYNLRLYPLKDMFTARTILTAGSMSSYWAGLSRVQKIMSTLSDNMSSIGITNNSPHDYGQDISNIGWSYTFKYYGNIDSNRALVVNIGVSRASHSHCMSIEILPIKNKRAVDNQDGSTLKYTVGPYYTNPSSPHFINMWLDPACPDLIINENELISKIIDSVKNIIHTHLNN